MKVILFITLLVIMSSVFGQGKIPTLPKSTSSESKAVKVTPDLKTEGPDLEKYVADYVRKNMADWLERDEFESTAEWTERIESEKAEKEQGYIDEILSKIYGSPFKAPINLTLGRYDADEEYFPIETNGFGDFRLFIKRYRARDFKKEQPTVDYRYGLVQGKLTIIQLSLNNVQARPYEKETGKIKKYYWEEGTWKEGEKEIKEEEIKNVGVQREIEDTTVYFYGGGVNSKPKFNGNLTAWLEARMKRVIPHIELRQVSDARDAMERLELLKENRKKKRLLKDTSALMLERSYSGLSVVVVFVVEKDGSITNVKMYYGSGYSEFPTGSIISPWRYYGRKEFELREPNLEKEIERLIKIMPKWEPGRKEDKPIRVVCSFLLDWDWGALW